MDHMDQTDTKLDVTIDQGSLHRALRLAGRIAPVKALLPVLQHVLIEATPAGVTLTATDMEVGAIITVPAQVAAPGRATAPARLLDAYVAALPPGPIRLSVDGASSRVRLASGRFTAGFATADPEEFPAMPDAGDGAPLALDGSALRTAIERVAFAAARDDTRQVLKGIEFRLGDGGLTLTACDGFRLARARVPAAPVAEAAVIVPARAVAEFARLLTSAGASAGAEAAHLFIAQGAGCAQLCAGDTVLFARLIEGQFPDVDRVIPREWRTRVRLATADLRQAVGVAALFWSTTGGRPLRLEAAAGRLRLHARGTELGDTDCELSARVEGEPQAVSLGTPYLADVLAVTSSDEVDLAWHEPLAPVVIKDAGDAATADSADGDDLGDLSVLMPMLSVDTVDDHAPRPQAPHVRAGQPPGAPADADGGPTAHRPRAA